jgi:hypothetical protein
MGYEELAEKIICFFLDDLPRQIEVVKSFLAREMVDEAGL